MISEPFPDDLILQLEQVSVAAPVGTSLLLKSISFALRRRDRAAIIGAAGAGKTILLQLLNRLRDPSEGILRFEGQDYRQIPIQHLRQQVVYIPTEPKLLGMRGNEAMIYPLQLQKLPPDQIQQRVTYWQNQLHLLPEWLEAPEIQLGIAQRQLIAIARGLALHPAILLLDNPLSFFDPAHCQLVLKVLQHANEAYHFTLLLATHQLETAQQWSQRVLYLEGGEIVEDIPTEAVDWQNWHTRLTQIETDWD